MYHDRCNQMPSEHECGRILAALVRAAAIFARKYSSIAADTKHQSDCKLAILNK